jgi:hypothetical protein
VAGLDADTRYYTTLEYEEVAGSGTWVEIAGVVPRWTLPDATGTLHIAFVETTQSVSIPFVEPLNQTVYEFGLIGVLLRPSALRGAHLRLASSRPTKALRRVA